MVIIRVTKATHRIIVWEAILKKVRVLYSK